MSGVVKIFQQKIGITEMNVSNFELLITLSTFLVEYNNQNINLI